jgi:hypothetical protein
VATYCGVENAPNLITVSLVKIEHPAPNVIGLVRRIPLTHAGCGTAEFRKKSKFAHLFEFERISNVCVGDRLIACINSLSRQEFDVINPHGVVLIGVRS